MGLALRNPEIFKQLVFRTSHTMRSHIAQDLIQSFLPPITQPTSTAHHKCLCHLYLILGGGFKEGHHILDTKMEKLESLVNIKCASSQEMFKFERIISRH